MFTCTPENYGAIGALEMAQGISPVQALLPLRRRAILTLQCRSPLSEHLEYFKSKFSSV